MLFYLCFSSFIAKKIINIIFFCMFSREILSFWGFMRLKVFLSLFYFVLKIIFSKNIYLLITQVCFIMHYSMRNEIRRNMNTKIHRDLIWKKNWRFKIWLQYKLASGFCTYLCVSSCPVTLCSLNTFAFKHCLICVYIDV